MTPLDELDDANLDRAQNNYFIGLLAGFIEREGYITRGDWSSAIETARTMP